ncbi:MAG: DUF1549 domain-containing protein [Minicystis sp.]
MARTSIVLTILATAALSVAACKSQGPNGLTGNTSGETSEGGSGGTGGTGGENNASSIDSSGVSFNPDAADALSQRKLDFNEALRTASLKLTRTLPTLAQIKKIENASNKRAAYEEELDKMFADVRFQERMIKWWQDTMRMGGGANNGKPSRNTAPVFAARVVAEEQPFSELFTAPNNSCPTYDSDAHQFNDGDCQSGAPATSGVLTDPGVMYQFYGNMAFRRVRWIQEVFVCTKFPAEYSTTPVHMGSADYTSPWDFDTVATAPINFQDTSSVICANCHTTINHIAPLFANFDDKGMYQSSIQVMTPTAPDPMKTQLDHWLKAGETMHWRHGQPVKDSGGAGPGHRGRSRRRRVRGGPRLQLRLLEGGHRHGPGDGAAQRAPEVRRRVPEERPEPQEDHARDLRERRFRPVLTEDARRRAMSTHKITLMVSTALLAGLSSCATPPNGLKPSGGKTEVFHEDPTKGQAQQPGAYNGGEANTFDHFDSLGDYGARDPFDILAQREEEGPAEVRTRLHSCQKITYATLGNILSSLGVDMNAQTNPPSAGQLYKNGGGALGTANYDARVGEAIVWSAAGAAKLFDIFVQAAPEVIANLENVDQCKVDGVGTKMFDDQDQCNADALACIMGRPATKTQVDVCSHLVQQASDVETGKRIAVATILAATHSCE